MHKKILFFLIISLQALPLSALDWTDLTNFFSAIPTAVARKIGLTFLEDKIIEKASQEKNNQNQAILRTQISLLNLKKYYLECIMDNTEQPSACDRYFELIKSLEETNSPS